MNQVTPEVPDDFKEYINTLSKLMSEVRQLGTQTKNTHNAIKKLYNHPHIHYLTSLTQEQRFIDKITL